MPRISAFYGIAIWMYHDESHHRGRPHFHATYAGDEASVDIERMLSQREQHRSPRPSVAGTRYSADPSLRNYLRP